MFQFLVGPRGKKTTWISTLYSNGLKMVKLPFPADAASGFLRRAHTLNVYLLAEEDDHLILILARFPDEMLKKSAEHGRCNCLAQPDPVLRRLRGSKASKVI